MNKILVIYGGSGDAQRYRCQHFCEQLRLRGFNCRLIELRYQSLNEISDCQMVIFHRVPWDSFIDKVITGIRRNGRIVLFDTDDMIFDPQVIGWIRSLARNDKLRSTLFLKEVNCYRKMLLAADGVLVSTEFLKDSIYSLGQTAWVHRNAFSLEMLHQAESAFRNQKVKTSERNRKIVIGYASGTPTHDKDFQAISPTLQAILRRFPETELRIIGYLNLGANWTDLQDRIRYLPFVPWQKLPELLAQFDINLAPLELDNPFCQAKSEIKFVEAALVQVPTIASATDAFKFAIRQGETGWLASTEQEWREGLMRLIENPSLRQSIGVRAREDVLRRYHPETRARELVQLLSNIHQELKGSPLQLAENSSRQAIQEVEQLSLSSLPPSLAWRFWYALRYRGLKLTLLQALLYLRNQFRL